MAIRIDDEAEPADVVFVDRDEEPAPLGAWAAFAADLRSNAQSSM